MEQTFQIFQRIAVIGAGSWGTALAKLLADKGCQVRLWAHEPEVVQGINRDHRNPLFFPDTVLPSRIMATQDPHEALADAQAVLSVLPSHAVRSFWARSAEALPSDALLASCTKGMEEGTDKLMNQVLCECLPHHPERLRAVLSGPSLAGEVLQGLPTAVVIASSDEHTATLWQQTMRTTAFLVFTSSDVPGVQVGGLLKNIIALAAGIGDGMGLGHNARAALITRGVYEMIKVGAIYGAQPLTFSGLAGLGDLVLTCTTPQSRNYSTGRKLGEGMSLVTALSGGPQVVEGVAAARAVADLARKHHLTLPICSAVHRILIGEITPAVAAEELMRIAVTSEMRSLPKA